MGNCLETCCETVREEDEESYMFAHTKCVGCRGTFPESNEVFHEASGAQPLQRSFVCMKCLSGWCIECHKKERSAVTNGSQCTKCKKGSVVGSQVVEEDNFDQHDMKPWLRSPANINPRSKPNVVNPRFSGTDKVPDRNSFRDLSSAGEHYTSSSLHSYTPTSAMNSQSANRSVRRSTQSLPHSLMRYRKICVLGHSSAGKSSIVLRFCEDRYTSYHTPNKSNQVHKNVTVDGVRYALIVLDTASQDDAPAFQPEWSIGTHGYILVYSVTDYTSFEALETIYNQLLEVQHDTAVPVILCGNKCDVDDSERQVSFAEGQEKAQRWQCCGFVECSAKQGGAEVTQVFTCCLQSMPDS